MKSIAVVKFLVIFKHKTDSELEFEYEAGDTMDSSSVESTSVLPHEITYDVDLEPLDVWGKTPLNYATELGYSDIVDILESAIKAKSVE